MESYNIIRDLISNSYFIPSQEAEDLIQESWILYTLDTSLTVKRAVQKALNAFKYEKREKLRVIADIPLDNLEPIVLPLGKPRGKMELTCPVCNKKFTQFLSAIRRTKTTCCSKACKSTNQFLK